jgi:hypothetical protein
MTQSAVNFHNKLQYSGRLRSSSPLGESNMPSKIDIYQIGVWFCVGFFTSAGWAFAAWLVGRILGFTHI